ncbi:unnamed protein product [Brassica oleracea]
MQTAAPFRQVNISYFRTTSSFKCVLTNLHPTVCSVEAHKAAAAFREEN